MAITIQQSSARILSAQILSRTRSMLTADRMWLICGCILSFEIAKIVLLGWSHGLLPVINKPYVYAGDALLFQGAAQRAIEGWLFNSPRMGFPFSSAWYDFPDFDPGTFLIIKILGAITGSGVAAVDLYLLLGFPAAFGTSFAVLRRFNIRRTYAACFALLFAFAPYHFARMFYGHMSYTWYFCIPLLFYYGFKLYEGARLFERNVTGIIRAVLICAALSSFGVYFAFYGCIMLLLCGVAGAIKSGVARPVMLAVMMCGLITVGVVAGLAPAIAGRIAHGANPEVAARSPIETEVYSLKIIHLLLPQKFHRIKAMGNLTQDYEAKYPLSNTDSSLGLVGGIGFLTTLLAGLAIAVGRRVEDRIRFPVIVVLATLLICTVGGLNDLVAMFVTPLIRGWDRFSIFVNFGVVMVLAVLFEKYVSLDRLGRRSRHAVVGLSIAIAVIGIVDQAPSPLYRYLIDGAFARYGTETSFVRQIEASVPRGSAIYQLPYIAFPESADVNNLGVYDPLEGFISSKHLRWSSGGVKGRQGDHFFRDLSQKSPAEQVAVARSSGFAGIYIDKRGYADGGSSILKGFADVLGQPALSRDDGNIVFFRIK